MPLTTRLPIEKVGWLTTTRTVAGWIESGATGYSKKLEEYQDPRLDEHKRIAEFIIELCRLVKLATE